MRVLVCGGRDYADIDKVNEALSRVHAKKGITIIIQGGARGADMHAANWGWDHGIKVGTFNADWKAHGKAAGMIRNKQMLDEGKPDGVIAFPGGRGTANMVALAEAADIPVWRP